MNNFEQVLSLIDEKKADLIAYEELSTRLIHCDLDTINDVLDQRESIIQSINQIDTRIINLSNNFDQKEIILNIIHSHTQLSEIKDEFIPLFEGVKLNRELLENIKDLEYIAHKKILDEQEELRRNIKQTNNVSKIQKYFETYETEIDEMALLISKSSKA